MLTLLVASVLTLTFNIQPVKSAIIIVPDDYPTIQEAINAANNGDIVFVKAGTYYENVVVNKSLTLIGENPKTTVIFGGKAPPEPLPFPRPIEVIVVNVTADNVNLSGFTLKWGEIGIAIYKRVNVTVHNNRILENLYGINAAFSNHQKIFGNKFLNNTLIGIGLSNSTKITVENNAFRDNGNGMALSFSNETVIYRNNFVNNTANGIMLMDTVDSTLINNVIGKSLSGIALINSSNNNILKNHITRNIHGVIFQNSSSNIIYHNNFIENQIQAYDSAEDWPETPPSVNIWDDGYPSGETFGAIIIGGTFIAVPIRT